MFQGSHGFRAQSKVSGRGHLLGFIREGGKIVSVRGKHQHFFDVTRGSWCVAVLIPLEVVRVDRWELTQDAGFLPPGLREVVDNDLALVTAARESSPFFVLMYPRLENLETSRGGVVVEKRPDGSFDPSIATVHGVPYLVELKGCGCPVGGFGGYHLRRTTPKGCHFHIAGALSSIGAVAEVAGLEERRASAARAGYELDLRAVGWCAFRHPAAVREEALGQVMRLCPSSLRASFQANDVLDRILRPNDQVVGDNLGRESACLLQCEDPRIHRNPSHNNLCYVAPDRYVLTDMEAAPPLSIGYEALDFEDSVVPDQRRYAARSDASFDAVLAGFRAAPGEIGERLNGLLLRNEEELNGVLFEDIGLRVFLRRFAGRGDSCASLRANYDHMRVFMPVLFFGLPWEEWVARHLVPMFEEKMEIVRLYGEIVDAEGWSRLAALSLAGWRPFGGGLDLKGVVLAELLRGHGGNARERLRQACVIGAFVPDRQLETLYVDVPADPSGLERNRAAISEVLALAQASLGGNHVAFATGPAGPATWLPGDALLPFLGFVRTYLRNERRFLVGAARRRDRISSAQADALDRSLARVRRLEESLDAQPQRLHKVIVRGREAFVDHLQMPYMR